MTRQTIQEKHAAQLAAREKLLTGITEHGGPCKCPSDVDKVVLDISKTEQTKVLKLEMQYQKDILKNKDKLLLVSRKSPTELAANLKLFLGNKQPNNDSVDTDIETSLKSQQELPADLLVNSENEFAESDSDSETELDNVDFGTFKFEVQGEYIAVAYEEDFHIGMVTSVNTEQCSNVQFLQKGYKKSYKWPSSMIIDDIESKFVFCGKLQLTSPNNGRTWCLIDFEKIQKLYEKIQKLYSCYSKKYF
jgi:hypothetical protein